MLTVKRIDAEGSELELARVLFKEYAIELNEDLCFQSFDEELANPLKKYGPPGGSLFIAWYVDEPAGCIALQGLEQAGVCEMKRLYVRPSFRKHGIGDQLVKILLEEAMLKGYTSMVLDTLHRLKAAIHLYERHGFHHTSAYYKNPLPQVVYMAKCFVP